MLLKNNTENFKVHNFTLMKKNLYVYFSHFVGMVMT